MTHAPAPGSRIIAKKSARQQFTSVTLVLQAFVVVFATVVAVRFSDIDLIAAEPQQLWIFGGVLTAFFLVISRLQGSVYGVVAGSAAQVPFAALSLVVDTSFIVVAIVFLGVWIASVLLGAKIDRERAAYDAQHPDTAPNV